MPTDPSAATLVMAFSLQAQLEKYGAYLGIAAFIGLTVLILLYFAQARELKRLRDWVGDAPERDRELEEYRRERAAGVAPSGARAVPVNPPVDKPRVVAQPQGPGAPAPATAAGGAVKPGVPVTPGGAVAPATAAATDPPTVVATDKTGAAIKPAAASAAVAGTPQVGQPGTPVNPQPGADQPQGPGVQPRPGQPAGPEIIAHRGQPAGGGGQQIPASTPNPAAGPLPPKPMPAAAARATTRSASPRPTARNQAPHRPAARARAVTPPRGRGSSSTPPHHRRRRALVLILSVLGLVAVGVFAFTRIGGDDTPEPVKATKTTPATASSASQTKTAPESRSQTTVAVLNGTTVTGLASTTSDKLFSAGFGRGSTGNNTDQQRAASLVLYGPDHRAQGLAVGRILKIADVRPVDPETQALAGSEAEVIVVVGSDQAP